MIVRVMLVGMDEELEERVLTLLEAEDVLVTTESSPADLLSNGALDAIDVLLVRSDARSDGTLARAVAGSREGPELLFLTGSTDPGTSRLVEAGASAVIPLSSPDQRLGASLAAAIRHRRRMPHRRSDVGKPERPAESPAMKSLLALSERIADGSSSVLILGETGSGKEWLARRIHRASPRAAGPFVAVNCAAIPEGLAESELFGHVRGAFTGAIRARRGHFEMADGGTLFLDEIADLTTSVQVRLLRVLQERTFQPVGSETPVRTDVRIVAAANRSLEDAVEQGEFRKDLYYRLAVVAVTVPPLRDRVEEIPALVAEYVDHFARELARPVSGCSPDALDALCAYRWPGNIRELINVIERAVLLAAGPLLLREDLPPVVAAAPLDDVSEGPTLSAPSRSGDVGPFRASREAAIAEFERGYFEELLRMSGGRIGAAAALADMSPRTLFNKLRLYGIRKDDFRP